MKIRTFRLKKLVRDKIVQSHLTMGGKVDYKQLAGKELNTALVQKLIEEAKELKNTELSVAEIADLKEILDQIAQNQNITDEQLVKEQAEKRVRNGGFKEGHFINTVTLPQENKWTEYYAADPKRFPEVKTRKKPRRLRKPNNS